MSCYCYHFLWHLQFSFVIKCCSVIYLYIYEKCRAIENAEQNRKVKRQKQSEKHCTNKERCIEKIREKKMAQKNGRKSSYYWPNNNGDISHFLNWNVDGVSRYSALYYFLMVHTHTPLPFEYKTME